jgi:integrase
VAKAPFLTRRDGRYWFQRRFAGGAPLAGVPTHMRFSLRTTSYHVAVRRMLDVMWTIEEYEARPELSERARYLLGRLEAFNAAGPPREVEAVLARRTLEALVGRFLAEAQALRHPVDADLPAFWPAWLRFVEETSEGEALAAKAERRAYERGRSDVEEALREGWRKPELVRAPSATLSRVAPPPRLPHPDTTGEAHAVSGASAPSPRLPTGRAEPGENAPVRPAAAAAPEAPEIAGPGTGFIPDAVAAEAAASPALSSSSPLSQVARSYLEARRIKAGDGRTAEVLAPLVDFIVALLGDKPLEAYTTADLVALEQALPAIPDRKNIPKRYVGSLFGRYSYAQTRGMEKLKPLSIKRVQVYHGELHRLFAWAKKRQLYGRELYRFELVGAHNLQERERDAWRPEEILRLFSLPLFTGAASKERYWTSGSYLVQNELYWAYLLIFFTGMRNSEIAKLRVADLVEVEGIWYFDLRRDKSVAASKAVSRQLKSDAAFRLIPLPPLILDLGILERARDLEAAGEEQLFPEWKMYATSGGRALWGHHFSKSWQYIKRRFGFERDGLTLYGGRHTRAGWYDEAGIPQRVRNRLLGHEPQTEADRYGPTDLTTEEARLVLARSSSVEVAVAEILIEAKLKAEYAMLTPLKTWLSARPRQESLSTAPSAPARRRGRPPKRREA